jgi:hypothetical protein
MVLKLVLGHQDKEIGTVYGHRSCGSGTICTGGIESSWYIHFVFSMQVSRKAGIDKMTKDHQSWSKSTVLVQWIIVVLPSLNEVGLQILGPDVTCYKDE